MNDPNDLGYVALAWGLVAGGAGLACVALWLVAGRGAPLLPVPHVRPAPWTGVDVWLAFSVFMLVPVAVYQLLTDVGAFRLIYGEAAGTPELREREGLWALVAAFPLQFVVIVLGLCRLRGARLVHLGLTRTRLLPNVLMGYLVWLVAAPLSLAVYWITTQFIDPDHHQIERLFKQHLTGAEQALLVFSAIVVAAVMEELVFRGVLLSWQLNRGADAQFVVGVAALAIALLLGRSREGTFNPAPALFIAAMLPGYLILPFLVGGFGRGDAGEAPAASWREWFDRCGREYLVRTMSPRGNAALAVYGNALMFGAFHSPVWPSPVPLVALGVGLAWLAYRSQSLVGPIVVHALFNAVACIVLFLTR